MKGGFNNPPNPKVDWLSQDLLYPFNEGGVQ